MSLTDDQIIETLSEPSRKVTLYDPHPGLAGCLSRLPERIRLLVAGMDGKEFVLAEAIKAITDIAGAGFRVSDNRGCVMVMRGDEHHYPIDCWRAIRYREVQK